MHEITTQPITQRIRYNETYRMVNGKKKVLSRKVVSRKNIIGKATTKLSKPFDKKLRAYLNTMGVSLAMLDLLHLAPPSSIHTLTTEQMKSTNLVTASGYAADLVSNSLCKTPTPADNCKVEKNFVVALAPARHAAKDSTSQFREWFTHVLLGGSQRRPKVRTTLPRVDICGRQIIAGDIWNI